MTAVGVVVTVLAHSWKVSQVDAAGWRPPVAVECAEGPHAERHEGPPLERRPIAAIVTSASYLLALACARVRTSIRPMTESDLTTAEQLSSKIYMASRRNEAAAAILYGFSPLVRERDGRLTGYLIPGFFGHGVAETEDDAAALIGETARRLPPEAARFFCPEATLTGQRSPP